MNDVGLQAVDQLSTSDRDAIVDGLLEYNAAQGFTWAGRPLAVVARDATGAVVGDVLGRTLGWLLVSRFGLLGRVAGGA